MEKYFITISDDPCARQKFQALTVRVAHQDERHAIVVPQDDELSGFGLKITPAGRKVYLVQYRLGGRNGRTRRVAIGQHDTLTLDQAGVEAKRLLGLVAPSHDPAEKRDKAKAEMSMSSVLE